ncbi:MAG: MinD/ParA family protein [Tissierellia bacterium]|nr:MinD/ParA family protein [Tissierellia bacterium]
MAISDDKRVRIIVGHYGSGKSEFSVNYAIKLREAGNKVAIADLDVVNLYFRSREKTEYLESLGIRFIASSIKADAVDIPSISGEVLAPLTDESYEYVMDIGGDHVGARTLGRYNDLLVEGKYDMFFVLNANRPETMSVDSTVQYLRKIEGTSRKRITGIVNNTHMLSYTTAEDIIRGNKLAREVAIATDIPVKYNVVREDLVEEVTKAGIIDVFPVKIYMREDWMV